MTPATKSSRAPTRVALDDAQLERLADLIAERLQRPSIGELVDAATLARTLGVARSFVYQHATELGGKRLGGGRGRLRFDLQAALATFERERAVPVATVGPSQRHRQPQRGSVLRVRP